MFFTAQEIQETSRMFQNWHLDIRTITLGLSLRDCVGPSPAATRQRIYDKICRRAEKLVPTGQAIADEFGIPIINKRISITPAALLGEGHSLKELVELGQALDKAAIQVGVDFLGGWSALVHKGLTAGDETFLRAIPQVLAATQRVCSSVNVATTKAGINMDAVLLMGQVIKEAAERTKDRAGLACAKLVVFANAVEDNPFMAGAFHGIGEAEAVINVGVSGPGVVQAALENMADAPFDEVAEAIKKAAFKITRLGEFVAREACRRLDIPFGICDLSLAPTPAVGDSVARIFQSLGLEYCGAPGTTAALALLTDAVKKGGIMASSHVGGLSGAFIPITEDEGMVEAVQKGALNLEKLEAMTSVCSVGLDMVAVPGDTSAETLAGLIADEAAIGMMNSKTTGVRLIPVPGKKAGEWVDFGGLLGGGPIMAVSPFSSGGFIRRGGQIPAPVHSFRN